MTCDWLRTDTARIHRARPRDGGEVGCATKNDAGMTMSGGHEGFLVRSGSMEAGQTGAGVSAESIATDVFIAGAAEELALAA